MVVTRRPWRFVTSLSVRLRRWKRSRGSSRRSFGVATSIVTTVARSPHGMSALAWHSTEASPAASNAATRRPLIERGPSE